MENGHRSEPSIFISHSSKDVAVARAVRNLLEDRDHRFVDLLGSASLEGKSTEDQCHFFVEEISSRDWLVLIDSENAQGSLYVQFEIVTARVLRKPFYTVDSSRFVTQGHRREVECSLRPCVDSLSCGLRVYMSYSHRDRQVAEYIANRLVSWRYETFRDQVISPGVHIENEIKTAIEEVAEQGVLIVLLSNASLASAWTTFELEYSLSLGGLVMPIALEPISLPNSIEHIQFLDLSQYVSIVDAMPIVWHELNRIRHKKFKEHCGGIILNEWPGIGHFG